MATCAPLTSLTTTPESAHPLALPRAAPLTQEERQKLINQNAMLEEQVKHLEEQGKQLAVLMEQHIAAKENKQQVPSSLPPVPPSLPPVPLPRTGKRRADDAGGRAKRVANAADEKQAASEKWAAKMAALKEAETAERKYHWAQKAYLSVVEHAAKYPAPVEEELMAEAGMSAAELRQPVDLNKWYRLVAFHLDAWKRKHAELISLVGHASETRQMRDVYVFDRRRDYERFWALA